MKMTNNYYQKHKERLQKTKKKQEKSMKISLKKKKIKGGKRLEKDI